MNATTGTVSDNQNAQKSNNHDYLLKIDDTVVRIRFNGEKDLTSCLADVLGKMVG